MPTRFALAPKLGQGNSINRLTIVGISLPTHQLHRTLQPVCSLQFPLRKSKPCQSPVAVSNS
ncbi:MAG: hypothetical protein ACKO0N_17460, partial [Planctomycetota bacterium]